MLKERNSDVDPEISMSKFKRLLMLFYLLFVSHICGGIGNKTYTSREQCKSTVSVRDGLRVRMLFPGYSARVRNSSNVCVGMRMGMLQQPEK